MCSVGRAVAEQDERGVAASVRVDLAYRVAEERGLVAALDHRLHPKAIERREEDEASPGNEAYQYKQGLFHLFSSRIHW